MKAIVIGATVCATALIFASGAGIAAEKTAAEAEFKDAIAKIKAGNAAMRKGDNAEAYCLFAEATWNLNAITQKYPGWQKEKVAKQIENIQKVNSNLKADTCKVLGALKEDQFRLQTWEKQVLTLDKLDKITEMLTNITKEQDENQEYIKDLRDRLRE